MQILCFNLRAAAQFVLRKPLGGAKAVSPVIPNGFLFFMQFVPTGRETQAHFLWALGVVNYKLRPHKFRMAAYRPDLTRIS